MVISISKATQTLVCLSVRPSVCLSVCSSFHVIILLLSTDVTRRVNKWWVYPSTGPRWYVWTTFFDALSNTTIEKYPIFYNWSKITRQGRCCFFTRLCTAFCSPFLQLQLFDGLWNTLHRQLWSSQSLYASWYIQFNPIKPHFHATIHISFNTSRIYTTTYPPTRVSSWSL